MKRIAIFASGSGSNTEKIIQYFASPPAPLLGERGTIIFMIVSNKTDAGVIKIAEHHNLQTLIIEKEKFSRGNHYLDELKAAGIDFIVLAGFLWKVPIELIRAFPNKIINIHPALLPKYGGKGMYGQFVHQAVIAAGEKESGITIHYVDELYDHGQIILQAKCEVNTTDTTETLVAKIQALEHRHFPAAIHLLTSL
jgi:phosphoribosylglycinamide formyltransferase 1